MKFTLALCCILAVFALVSAGLSRVKRGSCYCNYGAGTFCGSAKRIGQISGDCSEHDLYHCNGAGSSLSSWEGNCRNGCYAATGGVDYCK